MGKNSSWLATWAEREARRAINEHGNVAICWVKAHVGTPGNEAADLAAKKRTETRQLFAKNKIAPALHLRNIRDRNIKDFKRWWRSDAHPTHLRLLFPRNEEAVLRLRERIRTTQQAKVVLGHYESMQCKHRIFVKGDGACNCGHRDSPFHFALECIINRDRMLHAVADEEENAIKLILLYANKTTARGNARIRALSRDGEF